MGRRCYAATYAAGTDGLVVGLALSVIAVLVWRLFDGADGYLRDVSGGLFVLGYLPLLAGFAVLMVTQDQGVERIVTFILVVVASDLGGYVLGVLFGKHPMAPRISPKKSWEGFAGSVLFCAVAGAVALPLLLEAPWWQGLLLGLALVCTAVLGDLCESMVKRDLGVKDMGNLLPGHGGLMDRLDSLLFVGACRLAAPQRLRRAVSDVGPVPVEISAPPAPGRARVHRPSPGQAAPTPR